MPPVRLCMRKRRNTRLPRVARRPAAGAAWRCRSARCCWRPWRCRRAGCPCSINRSRHSPPTSIRRRANGGRLRWPMAAVSRWAAAAPSTIARTDPGANPNSCRANCWWTWPRTPPGRSRWSPPKPGSPPWEPASRSSGTTDGSMGAVLERRVPCEGTLADTVAQCNFRCIRAGCSGRPAGSRLDPAMGCAR